MRDRITKFVRMPGKNLIPHPKNWRFHDQAQREVLAEVIEKVGIVDAVIAYESAKYGGLTLVDGHLRREELGEQELPVIVLDLTDDEADLILATLDPIAGKAGADSERLIALLDTLEQQEDSALSALLNELRDSVSPGQDVPEDQYQGMPEFQHDDLSPYQTVRVHFKSADDARAFSELVGQNITPYTRYIWHPKAEIDRYADKQYVDAS